MSYETRTEYITVQKRRYKRAGKPYKTRLLDEVWNKGAAGVLEQTRDIEKKLPFAIIGFDCDNGSEFLTTEQVVCMLIGKHKQQVWALAAASLRNGRAGGQHAGDCHAP